MRKKKTKTRIAKGVLLISFLMLFIRLIYASVNAFYHYKKDSNYTNFIITKQQPLKKV